MGMKARPRGRAWYRRRIRAINAKFKGLDRTDPEWDRLETLKEKLINALVAGCDHRTVIEAPPEDGFGPTSMCTVRACLGCGEGEFLNGEWKVLTGLAEVTDRRDFTVRFGKVLIDLGIDIRQ